MGTPRCPGVAEGKSALSLHVCWARIGHSAAVRNSVCRNRLNCGDGFTFFCVDPPPPPTPTLLATLGRSHGAHRHTPYHVRLVRPNVVGALCLFLRGATVRCSLHTTFSALLARSPLSSRQHWDIFRDWNRARTVHRGTRVSGKPALKFFFVSSPGYPGELVPRWRRWPCSAALARSVRSLAAAWMAVHVRSCDGSWQTYTSLLDDRMQEGPDFDRRTVGSENLHRIVFRRRQ